MFWESCDYYSHIRTSMCNINMNKGFGMSLDFRWRELYSPSFDGIGWVVVWLADPNWQLLYKHMKKYSLLVIDSFLCCTWNPRCDLMEEMSWVHQIHHEMFSPSDTAMRDRSSLAHFSCPWIIAIFGQWATTFAWLLEQKTI